MIQKYLVKKLSNFSEIAGNLVRDIKYPCVILLSGDLGVGKTTLTQAIAKKLKISQTVNSPTFVIFKQYNIDEKHNLVHYDFYRLQTMEDLQEIGFWETTENNLVIIEWPNKISEFKKSLNTNYKYQIIKINLKHQKNINEREIIVSYEK